MIVTSREGRIKLGVNISEPTRVKCGVSQDATSSNNMADICTSTVGKEDTITGAKVVFIEVIS